MIQKIILFALLIFYSTFISVKCKNDFQNNNNFNEDNDNYKEIEIEVGKVQVEYLNYNKYKFFFDYNFTLEEILVNFYSINCDINVTIENDKFKKSSITRHKNNNTFSIRIVPLAGNKIVVEPLINFGNYNIKYNEYRNYILVINSIYIYSHKTQEYNNYFKLDLGEKEPTFFYFYENFNYIHLHQVMIDNYPTISFKFDEKSKFEINISDNKDFILKKIISNSENIFLSNIHNSILNISIKQIENENPVLLYFKIIENNSVSLLQKNYLNQGFITSNNSYQYYYMEVFQGEEGEIMLHNKRNNGKLFGIIRPKESIESPKIISEYLTEKNESYLEFDEHIQRLSFNSNQTIQCGKGCYILITYYL